MTIMLKDDLIQQISTTIGKTKVVKLTGILRDQQFALRDLIDLTFHRDKTIAYRSAWLLENLVLQQPESCLPELHHLLQCFTKVIYPSCQRHYAKIMMHLTDKKAPHNIKVRLQETNLEAVVEKCFEWVIDPEVLIAVKVFACQVLFNLSSRYDWIKDELQQQLHFLMCDGTAAIQSRGKKLLAQLNK